MIYLLPILLFIGISNAAVPDNVDLLMVFRSVGMARKMPQTKGCHSAISKIVNEICSTVLLKKKQ